MLDENPSPILPNGGRDQEASLRGGGSGKLGSLASGLRRGGGGLLIGYLLEKLAFFQKEGVTINRGGAGLLIG